MSDIEEILNEFVKEKYTQERKDLSRVIYSKFQAKQQTIDKLTKEVDIQTKFKEAYLGHWQDSKEENTKLKEDNLRIQTDSYNNECNLAISEEMVKDLNQLATDRGNEVHKLKEQIKRVLDSCDKNERNSDFVIATETVKILLTKQQ